MSEPTAAERLLAEAWHRAFHWDKPPICGDDWRIAAILAASPQLAEAVTLGLRIMDENDPLLAEALTPPQRGTRWLLAPGATIVDARAALLRVVTND